MSVFLGVFLSLVVGLSVGRPNSYSPLISIQHCNPHKGYVPPIVSTLELLYTLGHEAGQEHVLRTPLQLHQVNTVVIASLPS